MKTEKGYRFSLQFAADTVDQVRVGDFLEKMGNRKSVIIVDAISHYLDLHPELTTAETEVRIQVHAPMKKVELEKMIRTIIEERLAAMPQAFTTVETESAVKDSLEANISSMLNNLSMFG